MGPLGTAVVARVRQRLGELPAPNYPDEGLPGVEPLGGELRGLHRLGVDSPWVSGALIISLWRCVSCVCVCARARLVSVGSG